MTLCNECIKRDLCHTLCPEAKVYVAQDEVHQREKTIGLPLYSKAEWPESKEKGFFTPMEMKIIHTLLEGKSRNQIAQLLGITREDVRKHISNIRKKRERKNAN